MVSQRVVLPRLQYRRRVRCRQLAVTVPILRARFWTRACSLLRGSPIRMHSANPSVCGDGGYHAWPRPNESFEWWQRTWIRWKLPLVLPVTSRRPTTAKGRTVRTREISRMRTICRIARLEKADRCKNREFFRPGHDHAPKVANLPSEEELRYRLGPITTLEETRWTRNVSAPQQCRF